MGRDRLERAEGTIHEAPVGDSSPAPCVSVIVPCYNSARTIRACLSALLNQRTAVPYDVTVVDSSADETAEIVRAEFPAVRLIRLDRRTFAGTARNLGVRATRAPYCLMIDSDCIAHPELIERVMARHRAGDYAAVGGSLRNGTPRSLSGLIGYWIEFKEFMPTAPERLERSIPTANLAYRRETLERYGGFDDEMQYAEDLLFNWKLYGAGERMLFVPDIEVTHLNRTGWRTVLSYQVGLGRMSAVARRRAAAICAGGRSLLFRFPLGSALLPFARTARAAMWFARYDRKALLLFLFLWPFYFLAAVFWSCGVLQGMCKNR